MMMLSNARLPRWPVWLLRAGLLLALLAGGSAAPLQAQTPAPPPAAPIAMPTWTEPIQLSTPGQSSWFPDVFADPTGTVHVLWSTTVSTGPGQVYDAVIYRTSTDGESWTEAIDIAAIATKGAVTRASMLIDPGGIFHLLYRSYTIYYTHAAVTNVRANVMLPAREISTPDAGYFSRMAMDSQGRLHVIYSENVYDPSCNGCFHAFYRYSDDSGVNFSEPVDISRLPTGMAKPQFLIDPDDNLHVVWEVGRGGDLGQVPEPATVAYAASYDRGATWTAQYDFVPPDAEGRNIALGRAGDGTLLVAWLSPVPGADVVYYNTSSDNGRTWSEPQLLPGVWGAWSIYQGKTDTYMMTTDDLGRVYLFLVGRTAEAQKTLSVLLLVWQDGRWSQPQAIQTYTGDAPEWPRLSIGNGNQLNLTWFVRNKAAVFASDRGQYTVWYTRGAIDAPAVPTSVWPSVIAAGEPTATLTPTLPPQLSTPTPTRVAVTPAAPIDFYSEYDYLILAAQSILPVIALIAIAAIINRVRRG